MGSLRGRGCGAGHPWQILWLESQAVTRFLARYVGSLVREPAVADTVVEHGCADWRWRQRSEHASHLATIARALRPLSPSAR